MSNHDERLRGASESRLEPISGVESPGAPCEGEGPTLPLAVIEEAGATILRIHFQGLVNGLSDAAGCPVLDTPPSATGGYSYGRCTECGTETALYEGLCAAHWIWDLGKREAV